jgi:hypothetical protein
MKVSADDYGIRVWWNKPGRRKVPLFLRIMFWFLCAETVAAWVLFLPLFTRDWTVAFAPLLVTTGLVLMRATMGKVYGPAPQVPDYAAIARMERDIWGQSFEHQGVPRRLVIEAKLASLEVAISSMERKKDEALQRALKRASEAVNGTSAGADG